MVASAAPAPGGGVVTRIVRIVRTLASAHLELAQAEAARDAGRMMEGALLLAGGVICFGAAGLVLDGAAVLALATYTTLGWIGGSLVVAAANVVLGIALLLVARRRLKRPVMKETRVLMKRTVTALREA